MYIYRCHCVQCQRTLRPILQLVSVLMFADCTVVMLSAGHILLCKGYRTLWLGIKPEEKHIHFINLHF